jgi:D-inositol-3-phosphate glycosyltransferase
MNVYVVELSRRLAALGVEVDVFTRATSSDLPPVVELTPGVNVRHVNAGPLEGLAKEDLPGQLCAFTSGVMRIEAAREPGWYDLVHSHYWLSGQVGWLASERWDVPLVHTMHTMARVKNLDLAEDDAPEPVAREIGESQVVDAADRLIANTDEEAGQLVRLYDADPDRVVTVPPGVDLDVFRPGDRSAARERLGLPQRAQVLLFVGRIQPLKAPHVLLRGVAAMVEADSTVRGRLVVGVVGGPSGSGLAQPRALQALVDQLGINDVVRMTPPVPQTELADWYRSADLAVVPSYSESFGLVALEAQACGTPVVAAATGGLRTAVRDGASGVLVDGHNCDDYAKVIADLLGDPAGLARMSRNAVEHARGFGWDVTAGRVLDVYGDALAEAREPRGLAVNR